MKKTVIILGCLTMMASGQAEKNQEVDLDAKSESNYEDFMKKKDAQDLVKEAKENEKEKTNEIKQNRADQMSEKNDGKMDEQKDQAAESNEADQDRRDDDNFNKMDFIDRFLIRPTISWLNLVTGYMPKCPKVDVV